MNCYKNPLSIALLFSSTAPSTAWSVPGLAVCKLPSQARSKLQGLSFDHAVSLQVAAAKRTRDLQQRADAFWRARRARPVITGWLQFCREGRADAHARTRRGLRTLRAWQAQVGHLRGPLPKCSVLVDGQHGWTWLSGVVVCGGCLSAC